jgi:hypothetical protein
MRLMPNHRALLSVAEDIEWLQRYWAKAPDKLSDADVRRGGATLRRLLLERGQGALMAAWRLCGFDEQPTVVGPDLLGLLDQLGHTVERTVTAVAGGVPVAGVTYVATGVHRVDHSDGTSADAEKGFAVSIGAIAALVPIAGEAVPETCYDASINKAWRLRDYLDAAGGIRKGKTVSRRDIIQYFCKDAGGVHVDELFGAVRVRTEGEQLAAELDQHIFTDWRNGLAFEVLAIGHALGQSEDISKLATVLRELPDGTSPSR